MTAYNKGLLGYYTFFILYIQCLLYQGASQVALMVKNPPANAGDIRDAGSIPTLGRSPEAGHGNPLQYSCLENTMYRGTWRATVHQIANNQA